VAAEPPDRLDQRASDRDRDDVLAVPSDAAGDGRLALEEYSERADLALAARPHGDLAELTRDLRLAPERAAAAEPLRLTAVLSNETRKGFWRVPERLSLRSVLGDCHIELQDAALTAPVTTIEARAILGSVTIFVPDGVEVRMSGANLLGASESRLRAAPLPGAPVIEVHARTILGNVTVRPPERQTLGAAARALLERAGDDEREER
jgi:hypothetical protein